MLNVLLVEDSQTAAELTKGVLSIHNEIHISVARSLQEAKNLAAKQKFDLAIVDLNLPDSDGPSTIREFREVSEIPVLVLTGNEDIEKECKEAGAVAVCFKQDNSCFSTIIETINVISSDLRRRVK